MSDITDAASDVETMWTEVAIRQAHIEAHKPKAASDSCLWCGDPTLDDDSSFCSYGAGSCATDY